MNAVPVAVSCFLASNSFEDAVRKSVIVGGDSDTIGAITGALAEAYYGIPEDMKEKALCMLPDDIKAAYQGFVESTKLHHITPAYGTWLHTFQYGREE